MRPPAVGTSSRVVPELETLVALFYDVPDQLGRFVERPAIRLPEHYGELLAHNHHMTVTIEQYHRSLVDVRVLATQVTSEHYSRKILLTRQTDRHVVQFGIVRLNFAHLSDAVRQEIESQAAPVGRILIRHNVLRSVELFKLWEVTPGPDLCRMFGTSPGEKTYGRTALIHCNGEPAVELLEIVTAVEPPKST